MEGSAFTLNLFKGCTVDEKTGKRVHLRDFEFLKLYLHPNPKTAREKKDNKEALQLPEDISGTP
jgi:hypothetical protein